jgi:predicted RNA-binding Zn-ribbon protein involved in translation (DUF1610 family)
MAETTETERYREAWQDRRSRRNALLAALLAFAVLLYAVPGIVVAAFGVAAVLAVAWRYASFRCPRCNDTFLSVPDVSRQWWPTNTCQRCGLEADSDPLA